MSFEKLNNVELPNEQAFDKVLDAIHHRVARVFFQRNTRIKDNLNNKKVGVRTGRLRNAQQVQTSRNGFEIEAFIHNNVSYASRLEHGFKGTEQVKEHKRKMSQVFGKRVTPFFANVRSHSRNVNQKARSFFYSELNDIDKELEDVIDSLVEKELWLTMKRKS